MLKMIPPYAVPAPEEARAPYGPPERSAVCEVGDIVLVRDLSRAGGHVHVRTYVAQVTRLEAPGDRCARYGAVLSLSFRGLSSTAGAWGTVSIGTAYVTGATRVLRVLVPAAKIRPYRSAPHGFVDDPAYLAARPFRGEDSYRHVDLETGEWL